MKIPLFIYPIAASLSVCLYFFGYISCEKSHLASPVVAGTPIDAPPYAGSPALIPPEELRAAPRTVQDMRVGESACVIAEVSSQHHMFI